MSSENVEIVRRAIEAYNRGEVAAVLERAAPGLELDLSRADGPLNGVYARHQIEAFWSELADAWESVWIEPHEFIEKGGHVVVPWTMHFRGRDGIEVGARVAWAFTLREGAVERICMYQERADALEAVGLRA